MYEAETGSIKLFINLYWTHMVIICVLAANNVYSPRGTGKKTQYMYIRKISASRMARWSSNKQITAQQNIIMFGHSHRAQPRPIIPRKYTERVTK